MWNFQYEHGDRPLEGFTIERAAGRGGFGEVYFAVSDTGRQVALKVVLGYEQIELRGISQCMNLKSAHLITIFDVRYNDEKRPFVIMEYVAGPSLRQMLDQFPAGLGQQKAAFFLREMAKGLTFLHDNGIVHRDLKPANVFFENGYVKIGDYGLSKLINPAQNSAQTVTVGTVHYMAPEIGAGKYGRNIDIYALGVVLYEMLTGMVPFNGITPSEVLLKHLSCEPDTAGIAEPFATVIKKAMAKDPANRYQTVQEMVEAVFGAEHIRQSVSVFSPNELSVVATRIPPPVAVAVGGGGSSTRPGGQGHSDPWDKAGAWAGRVTDRMANLGDRMVDLGARAVGGTTGISSHTLAVEAPTEDILNRNQRRLLAVIAAFVVGIAAQIFVHADEPGFPFIILFVMLMVLGGAVGIRYSVRRLIPNLLHDPSRVHQFATGALSTIFAALFSFPFWGIFRNGHALDLSGTWLAIFIPLFCMKAAGWAAIDRRERITFWNTAFLAGLFAFILSKIFHGETAVAVLTLAGISIVTQLLSPWNRAAARGGETDLPMKKIHGLTPPPIPGSAAIAATDETTLTRQSPIAAVPFSENPSDSKPNSPPRRKKLLPIPSPFAALASVLLLAATLLAVGVALNFAEAIAVGLPDPKLAWQLSNRVFIGYSQWPELLSRLATVAAALLILFSITLLIIARRRDGILHIMRGVIGALILVGAAASLTHAFHPSVWTSISDQIRDHHQSAALAEFLGAFETGRVIAAGIVFVFAQILLYWTPRHHQPIPPLQNGAKA